VRETFRWLGYLGLIRHSRPPSPDRTLPRGRSMIDTAVRDAGRADIAFLTDCNLAMAWESEKKRLDAEVLKRGIVAVFDHPERGFYIVAERAGVAVGSLLITHEWSDWRNGGWWWIQSVYVVPEARRAGVFTAMYREIEARARASAGVIGLRLYVEKQNVGAQATYAALGMEPAYYSLYQRAWSDFGDKAS
jgi:GNAT superfamily N-acetyltransferase